MCLYIENFRRFEGKTVSACKWPARVRKFSIQEAKRARLMDMLKSFLHEGVAGVTLLRRRSWAPSFVGNNITLENGKHETCEIVDLSLEGLSLKTRLRPSLGEIVNLGRIRARVIRHDADGIAVEYVRESEAAK